GRHGREGRRRALQAAPELRGLRPKPPGLRRGAFGHHGGMAKRIHVLSEVNEEDRTAVCAHCGPVDIRYQSGRRPVCGVAKRERAKRAPSYKLSGRTLPHGLTQRQARDLVKEKSCGI